MPIQWDAILVREAALAIEERLGRSRSRSIFFDYGARSVALFFRDATLVWRLHPTRGDLAILEPQEPTEGARPLPATLTGVSVQPDDRVMRLHFRRVRGRPARLDLVVELMTNQWNVVLVEADSGVIRHVLRTRQSGRPLRVGSEYQQPPASLRSGADRAIELDEWLDTFGTMELAELRRALVREVAYTSSLNVPGILGGAAGASEDLIDQDSHGSGVPPSLAQDDIDRPIDLSAAHTFWTRMREREHVAPCVVATGSGSQPYPFPLQHLPSRPTQTLLEAFDIASDSLDKDSGKPASLISSDVVSQLEARLKRARRRSRELTREKNKSSDPGAVRAMGDLLLARLSEVRPGMSHIDLEGFDGAPVRLDLDPTLTPTENADRLYDRAGRAERALARIPELLVDAEQQVSRLEDLLERVRKGDAPMDEIRRLVPIAAPGSANKGSGPRLPYRKYLSSGGLEIRVGRGARWNDELTLRHAAPNDVWLHARHVSGAHVVLRWQGDGNPPRRDLEEAAMLAALNSSARTSAHVPVDWTRRKYVRKPRKAARGSVRLEREKTVFVTPDAELAERLLVPETR